MGALTAVCLSAFVALMIGAVLAQFARALFRVRLFREIRPFVETAGLSAEWERVDHGLNRMLGMFKRRRLLRQLFPRLPRSVQITHSCFVFSEGIAIAMVLALFLFALSAHKVCN